MGGHHRPTVADRPGHHRHLQRCCRHIVLTDGRLGELRGLLVHRGVPGVVAIAEAFAEVGREDGPNGAGQIDRRHVIEPEGLGTTDHDLRTEHLGAHCGESAVARDAQEVEQRAATVSAVEITDRPGRERRLVSGGHRERRRGLGDLARFEAGGRGDDLERRTGEVALSERLREQRLVGLLVVRLLEGPRRGRVVQRSQVRVVRRVRPHGEDGARARVQGHDRTRLVAEGLLGDLLDVGAERDLDGADVGFLEERVEKASNPEVGRVARQLVVVALLDPIGPEEEGVRADGLGEQVVGGIRALVLVPSVALLGVGDGRAVGRDDVAAGSVEVANDGTSVARLVVEGLGVDDLQEVELDEQCEVARHQGDGELAELPVHAVTALTTPSPGRSSRRRLRARPGPRSRRTGGRATRSAPSWR